MLATKCMIFCKPHLVVMYGACYLGLFPGVVVNHWVSTGQGTRKHDPLLDIHFKQNSSIISTQFSKLCK